MGFCQMENSGIKIIGSLVDIYTTRNYGLPLSGITDYRYQELRITAIRNYGLPLYVVHKFAIFYYYSN